SPRPALPGRLATVTATRPVTAAWRSPVRSSARSRWRRRAAIAVPTCAPSRRARSSCSPRRSRRRSESAALQLAFAEIEKRIEFDLEVALGRLEGRLGLELNAADIEDLRQPLARRDVRDFLRRRLPHPVARDRELDAAFDARRFLEHQAGADCL